MTFAAQLLAFQRKTEKRMVKTVNTAILETMDQLLELSPWGDWPEWSARNQKLRPIETYTPGRFKGSWTYSRGHPDTNDPATEDESGAISRERVLSRLGWDVKQIATLHYIVNNTPYAKILENTKHPSVARWHLVGHNIQLGHMIEATAQNWQAIVRGAIDNVG